MVDATLREDTALELLRRRELADVLAAMESAGVRPLVFKGAALAHTHYPIPAARPHLDVDLLVDESAVATADRVLGQLAYRRPLRVSGRLIRPQTTYLKEDAHGVLHTMDLHWNVSIPLALSGVFRFDELDAAAVPVQALGPHARAVGDVHALAIACVHRVAHHAGSDRAIWLQDIHLIAGALSAARAAQFCAFAARHGISRVCLDGITRAQQQYQTVVPAGVIEALERSVSARPAEPSAAFLRPGLRPIDMLLSDLAALPTWLQRAQLVREHLAPPAPYVRETYGIHARAVLPLLYVWRAMKGAGRWFHARQKAPH